MMLKGWLNLTLQVLQVVRRFLFFILKAIGIHVNRRLIYQTRCLKENGQGRRWRHGWTS